MPQLSLPRLLGARELGLDLLLRFEGALVLLLQGLPQAPKWGGSFLELALLFGFQGTLKSQESLSGLVILKTPSPDRFVGGVTCVVKAAKVVLVMAHGSQRGILR